jgi:hypothetical protein
VGYTIGLPTVSVTHIFTLIKDTNWDHLRHETIALIP